MKFKILLGPKIDTALSVEHTVHHNGTVPCRKVVRSIPPTGATGKDFREDAQAKQ